MAVSGKELATLDFGNLIGGPLNAIIEAQAKSALTTADFIKRVAFDKEGNIINVDFKYNRKDDQDRDQEFTLTVPFLTMLPVPYITVSNALIEFNAKITSITESKMASVLTNATDVSAEGGSWFVSARMSSKTAYQRATTSSDKEERTFDMHVSVQARNQDMPAGTERLLTILENSISEKKGGHVHLFKLKRVPGATAGAASTFEVDSTDTKLLLALNTKTFLVMPKSGTTAVTATCTHAAATTTTPEKVTVALTGGAEVADAEIGKTFRIGYTLGS